jgi:hypothetical protein
MKWIKRLVKLTLVLGITCPSTYWVCHWLGSVPPLIMEVLLKMLMVALKILVAYIISMAFAGIVACVWGWASEE